MTWPEVIQLIIKYGIPGAYNIYLVVSQHAEPTPQAWEALLAVNRMGLQDYVQQAAEQAGIAPPAPPPGH